MADMHTPLKPCPFCDGDAVEFTERDDRVEPLVPGHSCDVFVSNSYFGVRCERCDVGQTNPFIERSEAIATWNRRAPSQEAETVKALREALEEAANTLEGLSYIHDSNPSDARADMPPVDYARHMLFEARQMAKAAHSEARAALAGSAS